MKGGDRIVKASTVAVNVAILAFLLYVVVNPESSVRRAFGDWQSARATRALIAESWTAIVPEADSADPLLVEFIDYQCPFCRLMKDTLAAAEREGNLRVIHLHYPIRPIHPRAVAAARAAVCAEMQGRFSAMHDYLLSTEEWYDESVTWENALQGSGNNDSLAFRSCLDSDETTRRLARDSGIAARWGVRSTPTYASPKGLHRGIATVEEILELAGF